MEKWNGKVPLSCIVELIDKIVTHCVRADDPHADGNLSHHVATKLKETGMVKCKGNAEESSSFYVFLNVQI